MTLSMLGTWSNHFKFIRTRNGHCKLQELKSCISWNLGIMGAFHISHCYLMHNKFLIIGERERERERVTIVHGNSFCISPSYDNTWFLERTTPCVLPNFCVSYLIAFEENLVAPHIVMALIFHFGNIEILIAFITLCK